MVTVAKRKKYALGERLRNMREAAGYTQAEVAKKLKVVRLTYIRWEKGESEPTFSALCDLAALFDVTLDDFTKDE